MTRPSAYPTSAREIRATGNHLVGANDEPEPLCECRVGLSLAEVASNECKHCGRPLIVLELSALDQAYEVTR